MNFAITAPIKSVARVLGVVKEIFVIPRRKYRKNGNSDAGFYGDYFFFGPTIFRIRIFKGS